MCTIPAKRRHSRRLSLDILDNLTRFFFLSCFVFSSLLSSTHTDAHTRCNCVYTFIYRKSTQVNHNVCYQHLATERRSRQFLQKTINVILLAFFLSLCTLCYVFPSFLLLSRWALCTWTSRHTYTSELLWVRFVRRFYAFIAGNVTKSCVYTWRSKMSYKSIKVRMMIIIYDILSMPRR